MYAELKQKQCKQCKEVKSVELFRFRKPRKTYESYCKKCEAENNKAWFIRNKDKQKIADFRRNLKKKFGLTEDQYYRMLEKQNNGCAICTSNKSISGRALAVDHCHLTNKIRGLLCNECNTAIGLLKENPKTLQSAIAYIKKFKKAG